jgi:hypothetical protein
LIVLSGKYLEKKGIREESPTHPSWLALLLLLHLGLLNGNTYLLQDFVDKHLVFIFRPWHLFDGLL